MLFYIGLLHVRKASLFLSVSLSFVSVYSISIGEDLLPDLLFSSSPSLSGDKPLPLVLLRKRGETETFCPAAICAKTCEDNALTSMELSVLFVESCVRSCWSCCMLKPLLPLFAFSASSEELLVFKLAAASSGRKYGCLRILGTSILFSTRRSKHLFIKSIKWSFLTGNGGNSMVWFGSVIACSFCTKPFILLNGVWPYAIWYKMQPSDQISLALPTGIISP